MIYFFVKAFVILVFPVVFFADGPLFAPCLAQNVKKAETFTVRGDGLLDNGDVEGAKKLYDQAMEADFLFAEARFGLARVALRKGDRDGAFNHVNKAISLKPYEKKYRDFLLDLHLSAAAEARDAGDYERASAQVRGALKIEENSPRANMALYDVEVAAGKPEEAARILNGMLARDNSRVAVLDPAQRVEALLKLASSFLAAGDGQGSWRAVQKADREGKFPGNLAAMRASLVSEERNPLGFFLDGAAKARDAGRLDEAADFYEQALSLEPSIPGVKERLESLEKTRTAFARADEAATLLAGGKTAEAQKLCDEALVFDPECSRAQVVFEKISARVQKELESAAREAAVLEEQKRAETFVAYQIDQARAHFSRNEFDLAKICVDKAIARMPDSKKAAEMQAKIEEALGKASDLKDRLAEAGGLFNSGRFAEALPVYREIAAGHGASADSNLRLAECLVATGAVTEAEPIFMAMRTEMKNSSLPYRGLASITVAAGRVGEARVHVIEGLKRDPADSKLLELKDGLDKAGNAARKELGIRIGGIVLASLVLFYLLARVKNGYPAWRARRIFSGARAAMNARRWAAAASGFETFLSSPVPDRHSRAKAAADMAKCLIEAGRAREGLGAAREAMKLDPKNARTRCLLAQAFMKLGDTGNEALTEYRGMLKFEPGNTDLVKVVARCMVVRGDRDKGAREVFEAAMSKGYDDREIRDALLETIIAIGATDARAVGVFEKVLASDESRDDVRQAILKAGFSTGDHRRVADMAKVLLGRDSGNMAYHKYYTDAMTALGLAAEAAGEYEAMSAANPDDRDLASLARKLRIVTGRRI